MTDQRDQATDPWKDVKRGDRFYLVDWNAQNDTQVWVEVTDLYFDPIRGQDQVSRGYMVAIRIMGTGRKSAVSPNTLRSKKYRNVAKATADVKATIGKVFL